MAESIHGNRSSFVLPMVDKCAILFPFDSAKNDWRSDSDIDDGADPSVVGESNRHSHLETMVPNMAWIFETPITIYACFGGSSNVFNSACCASIVRRSPSAIMPAVCVPCCGRSESRFINARISLIPIDGVSDAGVTQSNDEIPH